MPPKSRSEVRSAPATYRTYAEGPVTLQSHILQQEALAPPANSAFLWILSALSISAKVIAARVRRARLDDDPAGAGDAHGPDDPQRRLDVMANEVLMRTIGGRDGVAII